MLGIKTWKKVLKKKSDKKIKPDIIQEVLLQVSSNNFECRIEGHPFVF